MSEVLENIGRAAIKNKNATQIDSDLKTIMGGYNY
jgi:hypothetical protein